MMTIESVLANDSAWAVEHGDCLSILKTLPDGCIQTCITSPPYWGLRDYGVGGQIGLEDTPDEYIAHLVEVFSAVKSVLRNDGTLWLNLGDSYMGSGHGRNADGKANPGRHSKQSFGQGTGVIITPNKTQEGLKPKDLIGLPWRVAIALQADGWYLRSDIVWHKPNAMPESVADRPTRAHEYIFLLSKSRRYYYDADAIKEEAINGDPNPPRGSVGVIDNPLNGGRRKQDEVGKRQYSGFNERYEPVERRNKRDVWTVTTKSYAEAHFATYPPDLIEPCVLAGCPEGGIVLDPFNGAGTSGLVATRLNRRYIGIELNPEYVEMSKRRIISDAPLLNLASVSES